MLRNVLCHLPGVATWPCDEINPVWRHGNLSVEHDAFPAALATPKVCTFIRKRFAQQARRRQAKWLVEKTCANMLRVEFVHAILPEARFLHITRDGFDVVPSAMKRWQSSLDLRYTLRKARFVPHSDLPHYLWRFATNRIMGRGKEQQMKTWGPRFPGMAEVVRDRPLAELCARQWQACEFAAHDQLAGIPAEQVLSLRYENFVADPVSAMNCIRAFLGANWEASAIENAVAEVRPNSVGNGRRQLDAATLGAVLPFLQPPSAKS